MLFRYETNTVFIEATDVEVSYFMHLMGMDDVSVDSLTQPDINALAESICGEVFYQMGKEIPIIEHISKEWDGEELAVEILRTDEGIELRVCPVSVYKGPSPDVLNANLSNIDITHFQELNNIMKPTKSYGALKKKLQNPSMKAFLEDTITDEFVDSTIKQYLNLVLATIPNVDIEVAIENFIDSDLCRAFVARGIEQAISKDYKVNIVDLTQDLLADFAEKIREIYKNMHIEIFYKVRCLDDAVKAMIYVSEGCILKVKDNYYLVTFKDNMMLSEFGCKVESFCYDSERVISYIKNGDFDTTKKIKRG